MASLRYASPIVVPATSRHTATVIILHGLGDSGHGWRSAVDHFLRKQRLNEVKFILPHAPSLPITLNGGMAMPGWFDIKTLGGTMEQLKAGLIEEDAPGILRSQSYINSLVQAEISNGIPSERIVLGGFSQGGAMSLFSGLTSAVKLAGIIGMSAWLPLSGSFKSHLPADNLNKATPVLMAHGDMDPVVRFEWANESQKLLSSEGYDVTLKVYR
ncbi:acyl-protein thioesterase 1 [Stachybotrys elegans]|uniref:Acyl-protein thioesterase 1 n=1 Tax=Stachybotrys elegans TaxID=80388 RepID=A0A8K0SKB3_9HYPO|nr:acyl-protein thioesterase 1 [Stachybotrys elegans]